MGQALDRLLQDRTVRFVITGLGAALFQYGLTFLILSLGAPPFWGTLAAYAVTVVVSYAVQHAWTFKGRHRHDEAFPRYVTAQVLCASTAGVVAQLASRQGLAPALISLATTLVGGAMSFTLSRFWVFPDRPT